MNEPAQDAIGFVRQGTYSLGILPGFSLSLTVNFGMVSEPSMIAPFLRRFADRIEAEGFGCIEQAKTLKGASDD